MLLLSWRQTLTVVLEDDGSLRLLPQSVLSLDLSINKDTPQSHNFPLPRTPCLLQEAPKADTAGRRWMKPTLVALSFPQYQFPKEQMNWRRLHRNPIMTSHCASTLTAPLESGFVALNLAFPAVFQPNVSSHRSFRYGASDACCCWWRV